jgi:hypothetical protein
MDDQEDYDVRRKEKPESPFPILVIRDARLSSEIARDFPFPRGSRNMFIRQVF